jgi:hypothetical protein
VGREEGTQFSDFAVSSAEVATPLGNAMGFVDDDRADISKARACEYVAEGLVLETHLG